ncbi:MAG: nicotinate-nicotinamide nucleotide adenylyltransferase [Candidatus Marinimicrobia bacterium]|nr:nicotinate-nicotinamide nucleotide adenylyltransferase [Candidatus Neomarinimicrobiota bacterium]
MEKRIAVFGGSFDPITDAHLKVIAEIIHAEMADEVWVIPCGPRKDKNLVACPLDRLIMCHLAVDASFGSRFPVLVKEIEIFEKEAIPTYQLMTRLQKENPHFSFKFVIGSDLIPQIKDWYEGEKLQQEVNFLVIPRPGYEKKKVPKNFIWLAAPDLQLAHTQLTSTEIRKRLGKDFSLVEGLIPAPVLAHIIRNKLYGSHR